MSTPEDYSVYNDPWSMAVQMQTGNQTPTTLSMTSVIFTRIKAKLAEAEKMYPLVLEGYEEAYGLRG